MLELVESCLDRSKTTVQQRDSIDVLVSCIFFPFPCVSGGRGDRVIQTYVVNFVCQKLQNFWADSDSLGKINDKRISKKNFFFNV